MTIIDEKGMLFEKINVIDFMVIVFLLSLIPMLYFGYKIFNDRTSVDAGQKHQENTAKEFLGIRIAARFVKLKPGILGIISAGDKEKDNDGNVVGKIVTIGGFNSYEREIELGTQKKLINKDSVLKQADVVLDINAQLREKNIYYKDKQIVENGILAFSTEKYSVEMEGVTIVKDDFNAIVIKRDKNEVAINENLCDIKQEFNVFVNRTDDSLQKIVKRLNLIESKVPAEIKKNRK